MQVDSDNFHQVRKFINDNNLVKKSKFIAFDLEFSGLEFDNKEKVRYDMFLHDRYLKTASVASKFNIVQIGITFVVETQSQSKPKKQEKPTTQHPETKQKTLNQPNTQQKCQYTAYPFNFYVFPRQSPSSNPTISMQASCVQFNAKNNMDWNHWVRKGITYVKISEINKIMQNYNSMNTNSDISITNTGNANLINNRMYGEVLGQISQNIRIYIEDIVKNCQDKPIGYKYSLQVPKFAVTIIRRIIQTYASQYDKNFMITKNNVEAESDSQQQTPIIGLESKTTPIENLVNLQIEVISEEKKRQHELRQKQSILGFTLIFEEIWNGNKTFVGHNCLFDILFMYASFVDDLPKDYQNFKKLLCDKGMYQDPDHGKKFYDTKYVASQLSKMFRKGTSLEKLYKHYRQKPIKQGMIQEKQTHKPIISLAKGFQAFDLENPSLHEAGFDSYLTAWVYLHLPFSQKNEGKIYIHKSYFTLNIRTLVDQIRKDLAVFVIAIVLNNAYVPYQQLRTMRITSAKLIRDQLQKVKLLNQIIVIDGFKQIFLSVKQIANTDILIKFLIKLKKEKIFNSNNVMSLDSWIRMKAEASAVASKTVK